MTCGTTDGNGRAGFALVVVLFSLLVLTALFAVAQSRTLAHLQSVAAERRLLVRGAEAQDLLDLALAWRLTPAADGRTAFQVTLADGSAEVHLQDVGGLVDLNTASPALLTVLGAQLDLDAAALDAYRSWRRSPRRLLRPFDFTRIAGGATGTRLDLVATVYSGRPGVAWDLAPPEVAALLSPGISREDNASPPSGANFLVTVRRSGSDQTLPLGTIHIGPDRAQSRVLALMH
jgi:hypothetical protein